MKKRSHFIEVRAFFREKRKVKREEKRKGKILPA